VIGGETENRQTIWVLSPATEFTGDCEECRAELGRGASADSTAVSGRLRAEADVGFATCRRGHRLVLKRIGRLRLAAAS
jgi:hypothetical protein